MDTQKNHGQPNPDFFSLFCMQGEGLVVTARAVLQLLGLLTAAALKTDYSAEEGGKK